MSFSEAIHKNRNVAAPSFIIRHNAVLRDLGNRPSTDKLRFPYTLVHVAPRSLDEVRAMGMRNWHVASQ